MYKLQAGNPVLKAALTCSILSTAGDLLAQTLLQRQSKVMTCKLHTTLCYSVGDRPLYKSYRDCKVIDTTPDQ